MLSKIFRTSAVIMLVIISIQLSVIGFKNYLRFRDYNQEIKMIRDQKSNLELEIHNYTRKLKKVKSKSFWELEAKHRLGLSYTDETIYKIVIER